MSRRRHELTDAQWEKIKDLLPGRKGDPGRTAADNRLFLDAIVYVLKTGIAWSDLPERYGKPNTVWKRFDRWCANGIWEKIAKALFDPDLEEIHLDSSSVKAHPVSSTGRRKPAEKRRRTQAALPGTQPRRTDNETTLCREQMRAAGASASDRRSKGRCSAGQGAAQSSRARDSPAHRGRCRL